MPEKITALQAWKAIQQTPEIVNYFSGIFDVIGVTIEETGEELTIAMEEDSIRIEAGLPEKADFVVPLKWENVENGRGCPATLNCFGEPPTK